MNLLTRWHSQSLAKQFLLAGGLVSAGALIFTGIFVTTLVEAAVTRNSAAATALYVDSVIAPILPDMQTNQVLDDTVTHALDETLRNGALGSRLFRSDFGEATAWCFIPMTSALWGSTSPSTKI